MYNSRINPSWLVVCAGAMLDEGVAVPLVVDIATVLTKAGFVGPPGLSVIDAVATSAGNLIDVRCRELVRRASHGDNVPYFHTASRYDGHLAADQPLDLVE